MTTTVSYKTLLDEYEATCDEMRKVGICCNDEVLYDDVKGDNDIHIGKVVGIDNLPSHMYEPPSRFFTILKDDGTEEVFEDEFVMKRKARVTP